MRRCLLAALPLLLPAAAAAQVPRAGVWAEGGLGAGRAWVGCTDCEEMTGRPSATGYVRAGVQLHPKVFVGLDAFRSLEPTRLPATLDSAVAVSNAALGPVVLWYPWRGRVFARAGGGFALKRVFFDRADGSRQRLETGVGTALAFGLGMDLPVAPRYAATLALGAYYGAVGDIAAPSRRLDDVIATLYTASVGLTLR